MRKSVRERILKKIPLSVRQSLGTDTDEEGNANYVYHDLTDEEIKALLLSQCASSLSIIAGIMIVTLVIGVIAALVMLAPLMS